MEFEFGWRTGIARALKLAFVPFLLLFTVFFLLESPVVSAKQKGNADRGEQIYRANCYSCHGVDPAHDGILGPALLGSSKELLTIRLQKGGRHYPKGYKPKRDTAVMPPQAHLVSSVDDLLAYINQDHASPLAAAAMGVTGKAAQGKATFTAMCGACHQPNGDGKVGLAPSITDQDFLALVSDSYIKTTIITGRPGTNMIPWVFLGDEKIDQIVAYLRSFQRKKTRKYDHRWKAKGNAKRGQGVYEALCAPCHGVNGKGYLLGGSGTGIGLNGFLSVADDGYIKQIMLSGREGTPMRGFGGPDGLAHLSSREMNDIIVYLRVLGKKNAN